MAPGTDGPEVAARALLARAPRPPDDIARFTSEPLFGQPGIYPDGPPMVPAEGPPMSDPAVAQELTRTLQGLDALPRVGLEDPRLVARAPDAALRAALVLLGATVAGTALDAFLAGDTATDHYNYGAPEGPGRIIGPPESAAPETRDRVVNERYRAEHFALVTPSIAHDLLHDAVGAGQYEEAFLHALLAMVHLQLLAALPDLADLRTELARRQHSLAITLFNSRRPDDDRIRLVAPDGPGTIPGGAPGLQSPDFWSIPFVGGPPATNPAPPALATVLASLAAPGSAAGAPTVYDDALAHWFDAHHGREWMSLRAQLRAGTALGLLDPDPPLRAWAGLDDPRD